MTVTAKKDPLPHSAVCIGVNGTLDALVTVRLADKAAVKA